MFSIGSASGPPLNCFPGLNETSANICFPGVSLFLLRRVRAVRRRLVTAMFYLCCAMPMQASLEEEDDAVGPPSSSAAAASAVRRVGSDGTTGRTRYFSRCPHAGALLPVAAARLDRTCPAGAVSSAISRDAHPTCRRQVTSVPFPNRSRRCSKRLQGTGRRRSVQIPPLRSSHCR